MELVTTNTVIIQKQTASGMTPHEKLTEIFRPYVGDDIDQIMKDVWKMGVENGTRYYDMCIEEMCKVCELDVTDVVKQLELVKDVEFSKS